MIQEGANGQEEQNRRGLGFEGDENDGEAWEEWVSHMWRMIKGLEAECSDVARLESESHSVVPGSLQPHGL